MQQLEFNRPTRFILVDLDDTLIFTASAVKAAYRAAFENSDLDFSESDFDICRGYGFSELFDTLVPNSSPAVKQQVRETKDEIYPSFFKLTVANKTLVDFLKSLNNIKFGLVTTARRINAEKLLSFHGLQNIFEATVFGDEVKNTKPHPECYLRCMEILNAGPEDCVVFEDSESGVIAAKKAGLKVIKIG